MLSVSFRLVAVVAMLMCIMTSVFQVELDSLNDLTARPNSSGSRQMGTHHLACKPLRQRYFCCQCNW